jgi:peptide deformylase
MVLPIISVICPEHAVLQQPTKEIRPGELGVAKQIADKLFASLLALAGPKAGLAAPQIGISRSVFIYSYDRNPEHLEVVINPSYVGVGDTKVAGWEGCLSASRVRTIAKVLRFVEIEASYTNLQGQKVRAHLKGFAAKAFQHEYDHLQGVVNINRPDVEVKSFATDQELANFMIEVRKTDALVYLKPEYVTEVENE